MYKAFFKKSAPVWAGLLAICITFLMFSLIPALLEPARKYPVKKNLAVQVSVTYTPQADTHVDLGEPEKEKPLSRKLHLMPRPAPVKTVKSKMNLPFKVNPSLAAGPSMFNFPRMTLAAPGDFDRPNFFGAVDLDQPLIVLKRIPPVYPVYAKQKKIQGYVKTQFVVNINGTVKDVTIIESNPPGIFDQSVINCITDWRFLPGTVNGEPANILAETTVNFELVRDE